ncbi:MAG: DUF4178 domain-containing protein [Myxococcales bacterium]|nr:DUF4178 domain-containing protein [Myxococcales bacterium]
MLELIVAGAAVLAVGGAVLAFRAGKKSVQAAERAVRAVEARRGLDALRVNDIVQQGGRDWLVEGVVEYLEDGHAWRHARGCDVPDERWFVVGMERQGGLTVRVVAAVPGLTLAGYPPDAITHDGVDYKVVQRGTATLTLLGELGADLPAATAQGSGARCRFFRYEADGGRTLLVEEWGERRRILGGTRLPAGDVELLGAG